MSLIKWIVGGAVGAVVGAAAWLALEHFGSQHFPTEWGAILVGILAGLGTRNAANAARINFGRGAVAMIVTLLFIVGAKYAYAQILIRSQGDVTAPAVIATDDGSDPSDGAEEDAEITLVADPVGDAGDMSSQVVVQTPSLSGETIKDSFSQWDMLWFGLSGFIAYQLGKSPHRKSVDGEDITDSNPEPTDATSTDAVDESA